MSGMFQGCELFVTGDISGWNVSNVTDMDSMFSDNTLFNVNISSWNVSNVTNMRGLFNSCNSFVGSGISIWNVSKVTNMQDMFSNTLFNDNISGWNVSGVTNMVGMFYNAQAFNQDISNWNVSNVTTMNDILTLASSFSSTNLSLIYNTWSTLTLQSGVNFNAVPCYNTSAQAGRNILTGTYSWTITDGGICPTPTPTPTPKKPYLKVGEPKIDEQI